jgi:hypothetical protein
MGVDKINNIKAKAVAADTYWQIQSEIEEKLIVEYIYHDCMIEGARLPKWVGERILSKKVVNEKRFKSKDILLAQNLFRAIAFVRRMTADRHYNITEADARHIHAMLSENLVSKYT